LKKPDGAGTKAFDIAAIPRSPGYPPRLSDPSERLRIYVENAETRGQLEKIRHGEWEE
jgi:hypothetical protein